MSQLLLLLLGLLSLLLLLLRRRRRREGEPPLIMGWIPYMGKALEFSRDAHRFLDEHQRRFGDIFTVQMAGKYMTFVMNPLLFPNVIKHGRQLDFHEFSNKVAPKTFGYRPTNSQQFPQLQEKISRSFQLLQGDHLTDLTESMMGNLMLLFRQDQLRERPDEDGGWQSGRMYEFCNSVMFEATFLTMYGQPAVARRHSGMGILLEDFVRFDSMFPLLMAQIPIWLLRRTSAVRRKLIDFFLPHRMACWTHKSKFIQTRSGIFEQYEAMRDLDKAAHHFAILWASVGNTIPACFWSMFFLVSHPDDLQLVRQEILAVLELSGVEFSTDRDVMLTREQLDRMLLLESAISESLRLSSASMNIRVVQEDFSLRLDGERTASVRKGDFIALYPQSMHLDPEIYPQPQTFLFDRFIQDGQLKTDFSKEGRRLKYFLMPFGSGSSMCPGRFFAMNEIKQFLVLLLLYFDLQLEDPGATARLDSSRAGMGILLPAEDVHFRYRPRTP